MIKYRGVAYYPEFWPQERWGEDIRLMKQAGINIVRIGEFAWTAMEPEEGCFTLEWLHAIVARLARAGIDVILCTPTATPPAWLTAQYPDVCVVQRDGRRAHHGRRRHYCPTSPTYRNHSARITERLAREFSQYKNVVGWQLDNEFGPERSACYCDHCAGEFRAWLRSRYGSLAALNGAWQTRFWSLDYTEWSQVHHRQDETDVYPSVELDVKRFLSDCWVDFAAHQAAILRRLCPTALVSSNLMGPLFPPIDYHKMTELFDTCCDDLYFDIGTASADAMACDVFRCMQPGKPFWITETGSGALSAGKAPYGEQIRAWMYGSMARGNEAHFIFRWRTCLAGQEQELQGILETSGRPRHRYQAVKRMFNEVQKVVETLGELPLPKAQVAMVSSADVYWAYEAARIGRTVNHLRRFCDLHEQFYSRNVMVDVIPPQRDFSQYKVLALSTMCIVDEDFKARLRKFVKAGGVVLATPQLACRDLNNNYVATTAPAGLNDVLGLAVESRNYLDNANEAGAGLWFPPRGASPVDETVPVTWGDGKAGGQAQVYMEDLELTTAKVLATFNDNLYAHQAAATVNRFGKGSAFYAAAFLDEASMGRLVEAALKQAGVALGAVAPRYVEVVRRGNVTFAVNHTREGVTVDVGQGEAILGKVKDGRAQLEPYGVCIVRGGGAEKQIHRRER